MRLARNLFVAILVSLTASGCAVVDYLQPQSSPEIISEPQLPPQLEPPPEVAVPLPTPTPTTLTASPEPVEESQPPAEATNAPLQVAVLLSSRLPDYERVAVALRDQLGTLDVYDLSDKSRTIRELFDAMQRNDTEVVIAIGQRAATVASNFDELPVVFAQVFNTGALDLDSDRLKGVSSLPPLDQQLDIWRRLNPNLTSIGTIVGSGHEPLIAEAGAAAAEQGIRFQHRLAQSDRETLYLVTRLVPEIDGYWLFPDNRILSAEVLDQMLTYAGRHQVQVAVFNDSLLAMGATLSTTSVDADVAATALDVSHRLVRLQDPDIPAISPLSDVALRTVEPQLVAGPPDTATDGAP